MYTQLVVKHFANSAPNVVHVPVPKHLRGVLAAILILHNPNYPRHFLNGCYLILHDADSYLSSSGNPHVEDHKTIPSTLEELVLALMHCPEKRWHQLKIWSTPFFSRHLPLSVTSRFLGFPHQPNTTHPSTLLSEGPSLIMSLKPNLAQRVYAGLQCYITQLASNSWIIDGSEYFRSEYPAKSFIVEHETILGWVCGGNTKPVGYIQFISLENEEGESHVLITGLAVDESYRGRGFGRGLIFAVIHRMWHCKEIWIAVREENCAASSLYFKCGFMTRTRHWDLSLKTVIQKM